MSGYSIFKLLGLLYVDKRVGKEVTSGWITKNWHLHVTIKTDTVKVYLEIFQSLTLFGSPNKDHRHIPLRRCLTLWLGKHQSTADVIFTGYFWQHTLGQEFGQV